MSGSFGPRALAAAHAGDEVEARRLEESADALGMQGHGMWIDAPRVGLGLVRGDLDALVEQALARFEAMGLEWHAGETRAVLAGGGRVMGRGSF